MTERTYAVVRAGVVANLISAEPEFVEGLAKAIDDPSTDTGLYEKADKFVDVTDLEKIPSPGWTRSRNGVFSPPPEPEKTKEQKDAEARAETERKQREDDDAFLVAMRKKPSLTQDERDKVMLILAQRGGGG